MKFELKLPRRAAKATVAAQETASFAEPDAGEDGSVQPASGLRRLLDRKRMLRVVALVAVAWAAGQLVQTLQHDKSPQREASAREVLKDPSPTGVVALSGPATEGATGTVEAAESRAVVTMNMDLAAAVLPANPQADKSAEEEIQRADVSAPAKIPGPAASGSSALQLAATTPQVQTTAPEVLTEASPTAQACPVTLDLSVVPGAMLGVTLIAPCAPNARVVLQHEGLSITGVTTASGALFTAIPAFVVKAEVKATLPGGDAVTASLEVPDAENLRRFAVQWQGDDAFQVHAYENGAGFGQPGHVSQMQPKLASDAGGFLQVIGDPGAAMPLLAEIYTYPLGDAAVDVVVESSVTIKTCGRELIGETLFSQAGKVTVTDLTLAMPDCDAIGDFLVLNNLVPDVTLAAN